MRILFLIILGAGSYLPLSGIAGDLEAGKAKAKITCRTCHGLDGKATIPMAANLSGQQKDYMIVQLKNFRAGKRNHTQMNIIAKSLTDDEIENLAEWYSNIKVTLEMPSNVKVDALSDLNVGVTNDSSAEKVFNSEAVKSIQQNMQVLTK